LTLGLELKLLDELDFNNIPIHKNKKLCLRKMKSKETWYNIFMERTQLLERLSRSKDKQISVKHNRWKINTYFLKFDPGGQWKENE
jgi:hypothetical protein